MNEQEQEKFEAELRRTRLARVPDDFMTRLRAAKPGTVLTRRTQHFQPAVERPVWRDLLRWLAPGLGLAAAVLLVAKVNFNSESGGDKTPLANVAYGMKADGVQVDQELVSSFDVVAKLPSGEPVRFRCRKWKDQLVVTDKSAGIEIGQSNPRVEVVPVRFETY